MSYKDGNAPEFPSGLDWLNVDKALKLKELKGKIVLLDFWTYCCINCMHIIPDLKKLEEKYTEELVVIGVHSAKFLTEQGTDNIRQAVLRYGIEHPVVNDRDFKIWTSYGAKAWPTVVLIDPDGNIVAQKSGEGVYENFDPVIGRLAELHKDKILRTPLVQLHLEKDKKPKSILNFPGKILADEASGRLFITDSNNNRIIITDPEGNILDIIGSGAEGSSDGSFSEAGFFHPQGTAIDGEVLYIADTENHLIRMADLSSKTVKTIAGTGRQVYERNPSGDARQMGLNSPWDVTVSNGTLFIAMAGPHQLWAIDLKTDRIRLHAGSGRENISDGSLKDAALAQPSGITTDHRKLYFADSEVSAVRSADISTDGGRVSTIIGHGLFEFGDKDGNMDQARLQHPLGIVYVNGKLYVADTYNNKIKMIDPEKKESKSFAGTGKEGMTDGKASESTFNEPGGISYAKGRLYVSDTNNDLIRVIDINSSVVSTLNLKGIGKLTAKPRGFDRNSFTGEVKTVESAGLKKLKEISLNLLLPEGYKLNALAPSQVRVFTEDGRVNLNKNITSKKTNISLNDAASLLRPGMLYAEAVVYYCREDNEGLCLIKNILFEIKDAGSKAQESLMLDYELTAR